MHIERENRSLADRPVSRCRFSEEDSSRVIDFMTGRGPAERAKGIQFLSQGIGATEKLTIADPYFVKGSGSISEVDYTDSLSSLLPSSLKTLELFVGPKTTKYRKQSVAVWLNAYCNQHGIALSVFNQNEIHDRVWISNEDKALVVTASFNGIGNKCAFFLPLDPADTDSFNAELQRIRSSVTSTGQA